MIEYARPLAQELMALAQAEQLRPCAETDPSRAAEPIVDEIIFTIGMKRSTLARGRDVCPAQSITSSGIEDGLACVQGVGDQAVKIGDCSKIEFVSGTLGLVDSARRPPLSPATETADTLDADATNREDVDRSNRLRRVALRTARDLAAALVDASDDDGERQCAAGGQRAPRHRRRE
jgi:hypothetical protein